MVRPKVNLQMNGGIRRIAKASAQCTAESNVYSQCIVHYLNTIQKDSCAKEFLLFQQCFQRQLKAQSK